MTHLFPSQAELEEGDEFEIDASFDD